jgi:hypothetical protein
MKRALLVCGVLLLQAVMVCDALAARTGGRRPGAWGAGHRGGHAWYGGYRHFHSSLFIGAPLFAPYWYPPLLPYYPLEVPIELEQYAAPLQSGFWYYCHSAGAYYPGVADCPEGWEQVAPLSAEPR